MSQATLGGYELIKLLGEGSYGSVHKAQSLTTGEIVALKVLRSQAACNPSEQNRFVREITVLQKLNHPNIVRHIDCGIDHDQIYSVMEYIDALTLKHSLAKLHVLSWRNAARIAGQVALGLAHAHDRGVIHRDLKPANLFLSSGGMVKIGDFGLARDTKLHALTLHGQVLGTPRYIPPEQVTHPDQVTFAADLYALGVILFEMLTGGLPFRGRSQGELLRQHVSNAPPNLLELAPATPPALALLVDRLLAKSPADRPASALLVSEELRAIIKSDAPDAKATMGLADLAALDVLEQSASLVLKKGPPDAPA
ncbi:Serine/threonine-protein kinase StkP [Pirellulimonas nuda]|uniref:Serine/threonine-protein kinase StkP n=1 Tax=Pirellulimonas nuda TaxID=2528009 RepID=A0A518DAV3_9BACT|nr:serine/threonine-protein kinase [Pirellulimonas nuda]QDU88611.1 Serine/threonine-protein kinase StkP [Pirellulimonas nuda]